MKMKSILLSLLLALLVGCLPIRPAPSPVVSVTPDPSGESSALSENLTVGCVENYDPTIDYFPHKATLAYASVWTVEYHNNYKVVTLLTPWNAATETFQYVLVQCGTPPPTAYPNAPVFEVPIHSIITMSSTQLPHLVKLNRLDSLVGHTDFATVNTPEVRALIDAGKLVEVGSGPQVNIEMVIETEPNLIMPFGLGNPEQDAHPKLMEAGLPVAINAEYMETTPLGRVEWLKYMALFFNEEARGNAAFSEIANRYNAMAAIARNVVDKPTAFTGIPRGDTWYMTGGNSYFARFLADAGARHLWADTDSTGTVPLSFEAVYDQAREGQFWFNTSSWATLADTVATDARLADFTAYQTGHIYNNNARLNASGGNDYWEGGLANPDVVLADLIKILHPELLPEHELQYYHQLKPSSGS